MVTPKKSSKSDSSSYLTSGHAKDILTSVNKLRKDGKLCDVVLQVEKKEFPAHRIVLASCSDYFYAMFTNDMLESQKGVIELQGLASDTMEVLLDFVYTETVKVSVENVQALLPAACLLQLTGVQKACSEFLQHQLDPTNCLGIRAFADTHCCDELKAAAENFIHKHFTEIVKSEEFMMLNSDDVMCLSKSDNLTVPSEEAVFDAILKWIKHDQVQRKDYLPVMLENVRLPLLSPRFLTDVVDNEALIRESLACRDLVDEAKRYHLRPECRHLLQSPRTKARYGLAEIMYVLGGFGNMQSPVDIVEKYDPRTKQWTEVQPMSKKRRYLCAVALGNRLFALGGYDSSSRLNTVECYNPIVSQWNTVTPMLQRRGLAGAVTLDGKIYVSGGFDGTVRHTSVECYDPNIDRWSMASRMLSPREGAGLSNMDGILYSVGGYDGTNILNTVERFDPRTGQWTAVAPMGTRRSGAGVTVLDGQLYAIGGYDGNHHLATVECYSPCTDQWRPVASMQSKRCYVGGSILGGKLCAVGGYDGTALQDTIEIYDVVSNAWSILSSMSTSRCDMGVCVLADPYG
ncbi:kelch-like protein 12 isoform X1 [Nematostella vectensis]|uniref:kelch-like protein 12 isoform X1 n=1 Tax=Nematostella vectensis TaxID=45351 RepID=UPI002076E83F|nr:kelch-like protein 12 isoform X1 [Nematostella vectensis]XP_032225331.2 kelch-like protein 12 isoform X1 [Nematostella vectensis]